MGVRVCVCMCECDESLSIVVIIMHINRLLITYSTMLCEQKQYFFSRSVCRCEWAAFKFDASISTCLSCGDVTAGLLLIVSLLFYRLLHFLSLVCLFVVRFQHTIDVHNKIKMKKKKIEATWLRYSNWVRKQKLSIIIYMCVHWPLCSQ